MTINQLAQDFYEILDSMYQDELIEDEDDIVGPLLKQYQEVKWQESLK